LLVLEIRNLLTPPESAPWIEADKPTKGQQEAFCQTQPETIFQAQQEAFCQAQQESVC
jgi:hypothetical protein